MCVFAPSVGGKEKKNKGKGAEAVPLLFFCAYFVTVLMGL